MERGQVRGLLIGDSLVEISHLLFVDVAILCLPEDKENFINALTLIQLFDGILGLHINLGKSGLAGINIVNHVL